ncbi:MAG TPA: hypothetical protein VMM84_11980 [Pyrinomonadaceae bacterium]|nr:hypothetical protein [Pyrinomonadaceae bacterium]
MLAADRATTPSFHTTTSHYYKDARSQQFRNGFVQGYTAAFRQYGGYNNSGD